MGLGRAIKGAAKAAIKGQPGIEIGKAAAKGMLPPKAAPLVDMAVTPENVQKAKDKAFDVAQKVAPLIITGVNIRRVNDDGRSNTFSQSAPPPPPPPARNY